MIEIRFHPLRHHCQKLHEGSGLRAQAAGRATAVGTAQLGLEIAVKVLIGVELRGVGWQVEQLNLGRVRLRPGRHVLGMVRPEVVHNQKHFVPRTVGHQLLHEAQCALLVGRTFQKLKAHQPLVAHRRDHRQPKAFAAGHQLRCLAHRGVTAHPVPVLHHCGLVGPVNDVRLGRCGV